MMKRFLWMVCMLLLVLTTEAQTLKKATEAQAKSMVEKINLTAAGIRTMECQFTQVKTLQFLSDKMTSRGRLLFMADGGRLRWEYQQPYQYTFVLNGQKVYIKTAKHQQTIDIAQSQLLKSVVRVMMNSLTGQSLTTNSDFACVMYTQGDEWVALLTPKRKEIKKMFKEIRLHFSRGKQMVTQVEMTELTGDATVITLNNVKTNGHVDAKMFDAQ